MQFMDHAETQGSVALIWRRPGSMVCTTWLVSTNSAISSAFLMYRAREATDGDVRRPEDDPTFAVVTYG